MSQTQFTLESKQERGTRKPAPVLLKYSRAVMKRITAFPYYVGMLDFYLNPRVLKRSSRLTHYDKIREQFVKNDLKVIDYDIDKVDFKQWLQETSFPRQYQDDYGNYFIEKALEHYLSSKLLDLNKKDVFVDVAASSSPWYELAENQYGCKSFAIDLHFPAGTKDDPKFIECDATKMPFENGSISKIALHCAFEMFENDADINLIKEAERVLAPGGKMVIIPLYMADIYMIQSHPRANRRGIVYGKAKKAWYDDKAVVRFCRIYSVEAFRERVVNHKNHLELEVLYFKNEKEMKMSSTDDVYLKFAARFTKNENMELSKNGK